MARKKNRKPRIGKPTFRLVIPSGNNEITPADRVYLQELHRMIDEVYKEAANQREWTWSQLASNAGLSYKTVCDLGERKTRWPRFSTVWRLCRAVGWNLVTKRVSGDRAKTLKLVRAKSA